MYVTILTFEGIKLLKSETVAELNMTTNVTPNPMAIAFATVLVMASELQIPRTATNTGLLDLNPSRKTLNHFLYLNLISFMTDLRDLTMHF
jgi:hypothetical protein